MVAVKVHHVEVRSQAMRFGHVLQSNNILRPVRPHSPDMDKQGAFHFGESKVGPVDRSK